MAKGLGEHVARLRQKIPIAQMSSRSSRELPPFSQARLSMQQHAKRSIADRPGNGDDVARFGGRTTHHAAVRHRAESRNGNRKWSWRAIGVAAEQRTSIVRDILAETRGKGGNPRILGLRGQRN